MHRADREKQFSAVLFRAGRRAFRPMPWRPTLARIRTPRFDPYKILVSEIMLQQTQVDRVRAKYAEFMRAFPTLADLSRAPLSDVLRVWSGLGYNRRAKYLHACAREISERHAGKFPRTYEGLVALPGIGRSTAAGIMAFAWNMETPMIDTNIRRILGRVFPAMQHASDRDLYQYAAALIPVGRGREWNYAMLDIGATSCTARDHAEKCPFQELHGRVLPLEARAKTPLRFEDSRRYLRGRIVAMVARKGSVSLAELRAHVGKSPYDLEDVLADLTREQLVSRVGRRVSLPRDI